MLRIQPGTRVGANHAQRADGVAIAQLERCASVKADMRRTQYQRVVAEARVQQGIGNHQDVIGAQRVRAEGMFARGLRRFQADTGFEPLAVLVHQRDQGDLGPQHACGHGGDGVEHRVGRRVQQAKTVQDRQPCRFIERRREGRRQERAWNACARIGLERGDLITRDWRRSVGRACEWCSAAIRTLHSTLRAALAAESLRCTTAGRRRVRVRCAYRAEGLLAVCNERVVHGHARDNVTSTLDADLRALS